MSRPVSVFTNTWIDQSTPISQSQAFCNTRVKYFGSKIKVSCFSSPILNPFSYWEAHDTKPRIRFKRKKTIATEVARSDSIKRAKDKAYEIAFANKFTHFITLTLDQTKINRYDAAEITKKLNIWLDNKVRRNGLKYIIFPEYHKLIEGETKRAIHFHGLISGDLKFLDSGHKTKHGKIIYNIDNWAYGFSTAVELSAESTPPVNDLGSSTNDVNRFRITSYVVKYMTKENSRILGKHYLSGGKDLIREVPTDYIDLEYIPFKGKEYFIPQASLAVKYKVIDTEVKK